MPKLWGLPAAGISLLPAEDKMDALIARIHLFNEKYGVHARCQLPRAPRSAPCPKPVADSFPNLGLRVARVGSSRSDGQVFKLQ